MEIWGPTVLQITEFYREDLIIQAYAVLDTLPPLLLTLVWNDQDYNTQPGFISNKLG